ncbi:D-sedoheptulose-7-phosphate isomerase [Butyrivibrio sp. AC2005]|uniref:D-sedoheptulose-7-phosphate isomerase n=1 Tax=Butyrivibrio sp. AC2005 TaxID=1280672 RepID=UPI0004122D28|nr:SIS domain-containing protein [Butyrivibrio sp. AC2005]
MKELIKEYFDREIKVIKNLDYDEITEAVDAIKDAYEREAVIYIFGNGGSAATASHFVGDFNKGISEPLDKKFRLVCLNDNMASVLAIANDISYDEIFRFQLRGRLKSEDLVIAISGSGNSRNVVHAAEFAKEVGAKVIGLTGYSGGKLIALADYHMHVNIEDMQITEDIHMAFDHMMYFVLKKVL